jgi:G3E family GTPase
VLRRSPSKTIHAFVLWQPWNELASQTNYHYDVQTVNKGKIKLNVVSGFLGAGKTTLINKFLAEAFLGERVAILENELGEIGIDGDLLPNALAVREVLGGCICCTLKGDFVSGIKELSEVYRPDRIIIEPTGVGNLKDVLEACRIAEQEAPVYLETALTVVNAPRCLIYLSVFGDFYKDQIRYSPLIVLSSVQKLNKKNISLTNVLAEIRKINPNSPILTESWDMLDSLYVLALAEESSALITGKEPYSAGTEYSASAEYHEHNHHHHHEEEGGFETCSFTVSENWNTGKIENLVTSFKKKHYGEIFRAKGFIPFDGGFRKFDYVYGEEEIVPSAYQGQGKFVVIGRKLDKEGLAACIK